MIALAQLRLDLCAERSHRSAKVLGEQFGLFPGRKVSTLGKLVVVDQMGICPLRPAPRRGIDLVWIGAYCGRQRHALGREERELALPI